MAAPINIPGLGTINGPDLPADQVRQLQQLADLPQVKQIAEIPEVQQFAHQIPQLTPLAPPAPPAPIVQSIGERALEAARTKVGAQYVWGATGPNTFDCSGLVQWAYKQAGVSIPRTSYDQATFGTPIPVSQLLPGDIVITNGGSHVVIYAGDGQILEASTSGVPVRYSALANFSVYTARRI